MNSDQPMVKWHHPGTSDINYGMKRNLGYIIILLAGILPVMAKAQSAKNRLYFRNGETEYNDQRYTYAIPFYRAILDHSGRNDSLVALHLAESYWYTKNYDSALTAYQSFEQKFGPLFSTRQHIAELLANKGRYAEAAAIYASLKNELPLRKGDLPKNRYQGFSDLHPFLADSIDYRIRLLNLNTEQQDFSPQYYQRGMVFVSNRYSKKTSEKEFGWDGLPFASVYLVNDTADLYTVDTVPGYSSRRFLAQNIKANDDYTAQTSNDNDIILVSGARSSYNGTLHLLTKFSDQLDSKYNYGPLCFNKAGDKVYFTRNNLKATRGRYNLEICEASLQQGKWGNIHVLSFVQPDYDFFHPALNDAETRLYFCSNIPGGQGGTDIYYVNLGKDFDKSLPIALDNTINTAGNELFPTFIHDTLYFSSDGLPGLGGLDIYKSWMKRGAWQKPVNMGYPINSDYDDFGLIMNGNETKGFFSSNRLGTDDIYVFEHSLFIVNLEGAVANKLTTRRLDSATVVILSRDEQGRPLDSVVTDLTGAFHFPIRPGRAYTLQFSRPGFYPDSLVIAAVPAVSPMVLQPMLLTPIPPPPTPVEADRDKDGVPDAKDKCPDVKGPVSNQGCPDIQARINELAKMVFFKTASAELSPAALKPLNEVANIIKDFPNVTLQIEGHTDNRAGAAYNKDLSQRRANSVKMFFVKKGFAASRFTAVGYGLERPIADNSTEEGRALNRRVAIKADFH